MVIGAIVVVNLSNRPDILVFPDDREQIAAERANQTENAYYVLEEAVALLPSKPTVVPKVTPGEPTFEPGPNSISRLLGLRLAENDPLFVQFLRDSDLAIATAKEALERPYFRMQYPLALRNGGMYFPPNRPFTMLFGVWLARANAQIHSPDEREEGMQSLQDLSAVLRMMTVEPLHLYYGWEARPFTINFYNTLQDSILGSDDRDSLKALEQTLRDTPLPHQDLVAVLDAHLRALDDTYLSPTILQSMDIEREFDLEDQINLIQLQNVAEFFVEELDTLRDLAPKPIPEYHAWLASSGYAEVPWADYMDAHNTLTTFNALYGAHQLNGLHVVTRLAALLELYRIDHGEYPAELSALVPDYIDTIPSSPATAEPFQYERSSDFYILRDIPVHYFDYRGRAREAKSHSYVKVSQFEK